MSKTTVVYHSADADGWFCREIARKFVPDATLIGWNYGDPLLEFPNEGTVYVLDLSPDCFVNPELRPGQWERLRWIDHHKSSIEKFIAQIPGYRVDGVAACRLAWQWFAAQDTTTPEHLAVSTGWGLPEKQHFVERRVTEPLAVRLAGEYDIWDRRDPDAELFQHGLRSQELTQKAWDDMLQLPYDGNGVIGTLLHNGRVLQYARAEEYREVVTSQGFDVRFHGLTFLACCSHGADIRSQLFEAGLKPHHEALIGFTFTGKGWRFSLYHAPGHEEHDLSEIAKLYGGGGHKGACGMVTNHLPQPLAVIMHNMDFRKDTSQ